MAHTLQIGHKKIVVKRKRKERAWWSKPGAKLLTENFSKLLTDKIEVEKER